MKITQAVFIKENLAKRFGKCKLELHPVKTRIVYCKDKDRTREEELSKFRDFALKNKNPCSACEFQAKQGISIWGIKLLFFSV